MNPPLDMNKEDFRRFGHELIDWIADYFDRIDDLPVLAAIEPGALKAQLPGTPPEKGEPMEQIIADVADSSSRPSRTGVIRRSLLTSQLQPPPPESSANC